MLRALWVSVLLVAAASPAYAWLDPADPNVDVVLNSEDTTQAFYDGPVGQAEWLRSYGALTYLNIKGYDQPSMLKWSNASLAPYAGRTIEEAELHLCHYYGSMIVNALVVSTINAPWDEGNGGGGTAGTGDPCWRWRAYPSTEWSFIGSDFSTASFGNFGTLVSYGFKHSDTFKQYSAGGSTWVAMKLDPAIVYAMILDNYGVTVTDPRFAHSWPDNLALYSLNHGATVQPRLYIKAGGYDDVTASGDVGKLAAEAGEWNGEVVLSFDAPTDPDDGKAFGYEVRYSMGADFGAATPVERWRIPRPGKPGTTDRLLIEDLTPGSSYNFWVQAYDKVGNAGSAVMTSLALPATVPTPQLADGGFPTPDPSGKTVRNVPGVLNYWACSELTKVNPVTGNRIEDGYGSSGGDDYKKANVVWNSDTNTVTLRPGRNEVIGFQLIVQRLVSSLTDVSVSAGDLTGPGTIGAVNNVEFFKLDYVTYEGYQYPEGAIPLQSPFAGTFDIPDSNTNPSGSNQTVWCDLYVPRDAAPGTYTGTLTLDCDQTSPVAINLAVIVHPAVIPDFPTFFLDLNGYGNKWSSDASRYQVFQLCQKHRMVPNTLPYGWSPTSWRADRHPAVSGTGPSATITNWNPFNADYGPFFDGSGFDPNHPTYPYHGPGENTPIANFYTTFYESWPVSITDATYGYDAAGLGWTYWNNLVDTGFEQTYFLEGPDVMEAFPTGYATGYRNIAQEFAEWAQAQGWGTAFQMYLNNKRSYTGSATLWTLEEQYVADDFRANAWFLGLCKEGWETANAPDTRFQWRIDTSLRWSQNWGQLEGICNLRCQGGGNDWNYRHDRYRKYTVQMPGMRWWYGTGPNPGSALTSHGDQILKHWSHGMDGGLPYWDNYHTNWDSADVLAVLPSGDSVPGHGYFDGRIATIRMKGMRYGQQLCEYLNMLRGKAGWNRNLAARALSDRYGDNAGRGYDAYGGDEYDNMRILEYYKLHADLLASIAAAKPALLPTQCEPPFDGTLPKTQNNVVELVFDGEISLPAGTPLSIVPIGGGSDVGGSFSYSLATTNVPNDTLKAVESGTVLSDLTWYRITPDASFDVVAFTHDVCTLVGDANNSGRVTTAEYSEVKRHMSERTDARYDLNGSARVTTADYSVVKAHLGSRAPAKP